MKKYILSLIALALLTLTGAAAAQIAPTISVQGTNATLRWASTPGESYVVLYRRAFHPEFNWTVIGTNVPASGGIETLFQHIGGVPRVPTEAGGGGGGGGGTPGTPSAALVADPSGDTEKEKKEKDKQKDGGFPAFPELPDEKAIEKWLKDMMKEYERMQREGGTGQPVMALMSSSLTAEQATNNSMGFYIVLNSADDSNGDGVPDGLAAQHGVNPLNDLTQTDSDGDGLTDQQEIVFGSNPLKTDTDGDGLSDYWELTYDSNPRNPLGGPGMFPTYYTVSGTNYHTNQGVLHTTFRSFRYDRYLGAWESNRTVLAVPVGDVTSYTTLSLWPWKQGTIGYGTNYEWAHFTGGATVLIFSDTNVAPAQTISDIWPIGNVEDGTYQGQFAMVTHGTNSAMRRAYEIQLEAWDGTNLATATPITDFTGFSIMGQAATADGKVFFLAPEDTLTNASVVTPVQYAQLFLRATPTLVPIDIQEVISDQIAGNEANKLPTAYFAGKANNPMLFATRSGTDARIAVRVAYAAALRTNAMVGVRKMGSTTILASAPAQQAPDRTLLQFTAENGSQTYEVVAGYDYNSNGTLDAVEVTVVFSKTPKTDDAGNPATKFLELVDKIIVVTKADYDAGVSASLGYANYFGVGYAGDLIRAFVTGSTNVTNAVLTTGLTVSATTGGLAHPLGGKWDANSEDITYRFSFEDGTPASDEFESTTALAAAIDETIFANIDDLLLNGSALFVTTRQVDISSSVDLVKTEGKTRIAAAFGKITFGGPLLVDYVKTSATAINVTRVRATGSFDDVYDFNYGAGPVTLLGVVIAEPKEAARVQAGHATLSTPAAPGGKVFYTRLEYDTGWLQLNLNYSK